MKKFGILTTIDHPLLPFFLSSFIKNNLKEFYIICDSKLKNEKSTKIWNERTSGKFENNYKNKLVELEKLNSAKFHFVDDHNSELALNLYSELKINCLFNAGTPRKILKKTIEQMEYGVVNIHPGILPKYRGSCAVEWAILNNDHIGLTAHLMNEEYDAGPIIEIHKVLFPDTYDYHDIRNKVFFDTTAMAGKILKKIQINFEGLNITPQKEEDSKYWEPIDDNTLEKVKLKIKSGEYIKKIQK